VVITATSQNGVSVEIDTTIYYGLHLITDRTEEDVNRVKAMLAKGWATLTEEEQAEWNAGMKGAYNYKDLNRVEMAVSYLKDYLGSYGYVADIGPLRTWTEKDVPTVSDMQRYLDNVRIIRSVLTVFPSTPQVPESMENFTFTKANQLEKILQDVESLVKNMVAASIQAGEIYGGEM
jgi:chaperonin GroEL (HSP60 family)